MARRNRRKKDSKKSGTNSNTSSNDNNIVTVASIKPVTENEIKSDLEKTASGLTSSSSKKEWLSNILNVLKLLSSLGSGFVLTITAIRAYIFSAYYGVPFTDLINIKITGELIIQVIPVIAIIGLRQLIQLTWFH